jgi:hypothetical protein
MESQPIHAAAVIDALRASVHAAVTDELNAHRHGSIAAQQVARQTLWNARHALEVAHLENRVQHLNQRCQQTGYAQDVDDAVDAERRLATLKAAGPRTSL